uniref:Uncharacterized protein n=1 Tax=Arsenophonus nasoniae TaxID=638 RepID=D2TY40_9GAMM|nr:hypothetical protein ARN_10440 [Arsenophonus nasoniae]
MVKLELCFHRLSMMVFSSAIFSLSLSISFILVSSFLFVAENFFNFCVYQLVIHVINLFYHIFLFFINKVVVLIFYIFESVVLIFG